MKQRLLMVLSAFLLSVCSSAQAATECFFNAVQKAVDLNVSDLSFTNVSSPQTGYKEIVPGGSFTITPTDSNITSDCNAGKGGQALRGKNMRPGSTNYKYVTVKDAKGNSHQAVLYNTTAPGIYYTVKITNDTCKDNSGYIPANNSYTTLYDVGDDNEKNCMKGDRPFTFGLNFYVGSDYKVPKKNTFQSNEVVHGNFNISGAVDEVAVRTVIFVATLK